MRTLDMVVGLGWIGLLATVLVGQAILAWWRFRWATGLARKAERLSRSLEDERAPQLQGRVPRPAQSAGPGAVVTHR
jgi:hypothetical protein